VSGLIKRRAELAGEIERTQPHAVAILACDNTEAIVLDFMQPQVAGGQPVGLCGKARRDEPGGEATLQHVRAGTAFILTRSLRQKRKACPTCSYPGS
jgi:hypothetical protein